MTKSPFTDPEVVIYGRQSKYCPVVAPDYEAQLELAKTKNLSTVEFNELVKDLGLCFKCREPGHFANRCTKELEKIVCYKCFKKGHYATRCREPKPDNAKRPSFLCFQTAEERKDWPMDPVFLIERLPKA